MEEIRAGELNGFTAASSFSGCGGDCLGMRMAGFRVGWASEFIPAAAETYRANFPSTPLDTRDIRQVQPADVLEVLGLERGELDLWGGSPPCAPFSTAGVRHEGWSEVRKYSDTEQRVDDLFGEYVRMVEGLQPRVFTAENVSGLVKGVAKGFFLEILAALKAAGYRVRAQVLDASWLGVPQARQRLFFVGVREDLGAEPAFPLPLRYRYTVRDALPWISGQGDNGGFIGGGGIQSSDHPSPTLLASGPTGGNGRFPPGVVLTERQFRPDVLDDITDEPVPTIRTPGGGAGTRSIRVVHDTSGQRSQGDVTDRPAPTVTVGANSADSHHYQIHGGELLTHDPETGEDITIGRNADIRRAWERHARDGAHARKLTLTELRALCSFPADFVLTGTYRQRWERCGRAVPPLMAYHLAATVRDQILAPLRAQGVI